MSKIKDGIVKSHKLIKYLNFLLLKRKLLSYTSIAIIFLLLLFFFVYLPYTNTVSKIKVMDNLLYRLEGNLNQLHLLKEKMKKRNGILNSILNDFKANSIEYSSKDNVISFNPGYLKFDKFIELLESIQKTGFIQILRLKINNLTGNEKNIIAPNKYIYLEELVIYSTTKETK